MPLMNLVSAGGIGKATVTGTSGSPTVNNNGRAGKTIYAFNGSGSITVGTAGTAEILVVGGGGGGGYGGPDSAGGAGAGGVLYDSSAILPSGTLTVTVGAGGPANTSLTSTKPGTSSVLGDFYGFGGGQGGDYIPQNGIGFSGGFGGSGGGGAFNNLAPGGAGLGVPGQGFDGAAALSNRTGGGGGAGAAATTQNGGNGLAVNINGSSVTYGGGGAGSWQNVSASGGSGGGGNGGYGNLTNNRRGNAGTAGLGGGGGAGLYSDTPGAGGSGIVIVVVG
jgi:hypothetical protein